MASRKKARGKVRTTVPDPEHFVSREFVGPFSLPRRLRAHAELPGGVEAIVEIAVSGGRARAEAVTVRHPRGVGWTALATVPVRDIVATACLSTLMRTVVLPDGTARLEPVGREDWRAARDAIRGLVGYAPRTEGLEVVE
ncbi:MAG TPA: hypothetical protein VNO79_04970 [Actinomycetota bacterium]|nr:hypothetical protein [Actinomycetota bacterium]